MKNQQKKTQANQDKSQQAGKNAGVLSTEKADQNEAKKNKMTTKKGESYRESER